MTVSNKYSITLFLISILISILNAQVYNPSYVTTVSDITAVSSDYFPSPISPGGSLNVTTPRYYDALQLAMTITDPIFGASAIVNSIEAWATNFKNQLYSSSVSFVSILNSISRIDDIPPQKYYDASINIGLLEAPFVTLHSEGQSIISAINTIKTSFVGVTLTTAQQAQLNQFDAVISKITLCNIASNINIHITSARYASNDSGSVAQDVVDGFSTVAEVAPYIVSNNVKALRTAYDFYISYQTLNNNF